MLQEGSIVTVIGLQGVVKYKPSFGYWIDFHDGNIFSHDTNCRKIANHFGFEKLMYLLINKYPNLYTNQTAGVIFPYFENLHKLTLFIYYLKDSQSHSITIF